MDHDVKNEAVSGERTFSHHSTEEEETHSEYTNRLEKDTAIHSRLLEMRIFPNVKEVTEAMAAYIHTERYILSSCDTPLENPHLKDCILCVGDGSTPRSAILFALYQAGWECYSIDPQLQEGYIKTHPHEELKTRRDMNAIRKQCREMWMQIPNMHIVGECIQTVRIRCRRVIIVMIHCHLSFQEVMSSVECEEIIGVLTLPCCNYIQVQELFMGQSPSFEFQDKAILSEKNMVRIWVKPLCRWIDTYQPFFTDRILLPFALPSEKHLVSAYELRSMSATHQHVCIAGEVITKRLFGKRLAFLFINTSNVYYDQSKYVYYDTNSYSAHNVCLTPMVICLKLDLSLMCKEKGEDLMKQVKKRSILFIEGCVVKSSIEQNIVEMEEMSIIASNDMVRKAQRYICGIPTEILNIPSNNRRNINYMNED